MATTERVNEQQTLTEPEPQEVCLARLLMGKRGRRSFDVPVYLNLSEHPELQPFVDREHSNGVIKVVFGLENVVLAGRFIHFRDLAAEEFIRQNRLVV